MSDTQTVPDSVTDEIDSKLAVADATAAEVQAEDAAAGTPDADAAAVPSESTDAAADGEPATRTVKSGEDRRPRGWLETDVKAITDAFVQGEITLGEGQHLTPHRLSRLVKERDGLDEAPSTGACAAVLSRWVELGFIEVSKTPFAFKDYTEAGRTEGLTALKAKRSEDRKQARAATKAALDAANPKPDKKGKGKKAESTEGAPADAAASTDTPAADSAS